MRLLSTKKLGLIFVIALIAALVLPMGVEARDMIVGSGLMDDAPGVTLDFEPATATATTCSETVIYFDVNDVSVEQPMTAFHLEATFDKDVVEIISVESGGFLQGTLMDEPGQDLGNEFGRLKWGYAQQAVGGVNTPRSGSGHLLKITLRAKTAGTTTFAIDAVNSLLVDWPDVFPIPFTVSGTSEVTTSVCAPTDISLSNMSVKENLSVSTTVGMLSVVDADEDETFTFSLATGGDNDKFKIDGNELQTKQIFNFEEKSSYTITIRATNEGGAYVDKAFTITIVNVNDAPVLATIGAKSVKNTGTLSFTPTATDEDGDTLTWSLGTGAPSWVSIVTTSGEVTLIPTTATAPGTYSAQVCVSDGALSDCETITITVTDGEAPTIVSGKANGAAGFDDVDMVGTTFTVPQGYEVDHIDFTMSEAVSIVAPGIVYFEGNPYGTMTAAGNVITVTPYPGNETAGVPGTFTFTIAAGSVTDLAGNPLETLTATMIVKDALVVSDADLFYSTDPAKIDQALGGDFADGFEMVLDPMVPWYYLDTQVITSNNTLEDGLYPFYMDPDETTPIFYVKVAGTDLMLVDAFLLDRDEVELPLRINGDFTPGVYTYSGELEDIYGSTASVSIEIEFNDLPYANDQTVTTNEDTAVAITLGAVDLYPGTLTWTVGDPAHGTLTGSEPNLTYTPDADWYGTDSFTFTVNDGTLTSASATVTINVTSVVDLPAVSSTNLPGPYMVGLEQAFQVTLTNPSNGDAFTNVLARFRLEGIDLADIASFLYLETSVTPNVWLDLPLAQDGDDVIGDFGPSAGFPMGVPYNATSQFKVTVNKPGTYAATIVLYDLSADPDAELARYEADVVVTAEFAVTDLVLTSSVDKLDWLDVTGSFAAGFAMPLDTTEDYYYFGMSSITATRPLADGSYPFYLAEHPGAAFFAYWAAEGVVEGATGWKGQMWEIINGDAPMSTLVVEGTTYTLIDGLQGEPNLLRVDGDYLPGAYRFSSVVEDEFGFSDTLEVKVTFNDIPVAADQTVTTNEDTTVDITLSAVDLYPGTLTWTVGDPAHGELTGTAPNLTYTPDADWHGTDSFTFTVSDGTLTSESATVTINVISINDAPVAVNDTRSTSFETKLTVDAPGVLANDSDVDGDDLTAVLDNGPINGTLTLNADGSFEYIPNTAFTGNDSFTYQASDGTLSSNTATVTITVTPWVNTPPVAMDDAYETDQNVKLEVAAPGVLANDSDIDDDVLKAALLTSVSDGTLVLLENGSFTYTPDTDFCGTDSFTYTLVSHPKINQDGWTDTATVTITVYCDAIISSDDLDGPFYVGNLQEFNVRFQNPAPGHTYGTLAASIFADNITAADYSVIEVKHPVSGSWIPLVPVVDGTGMRIDLGPSMAIPITSGLDLTLTFRVNFNTAGSYPVTGTLYDSLIQPDKAIATYSDTMVVAGLVAQDFGYMNFSDVMGVSAGFGNINFDLSEATEIKVELFTGTSPDYDLLQTNTAVDPDAMATWTQFSGPFDIFGTFDYVADNFWENVRETPEYGQTAIPTRVLATITLPEGITLTAENTNLTGERGYIIDTLDEELASAPDYEYDPAYIPVGDIDFDLSSNTYTGTYTAPQVLAGAPMNDLARYLGALYRQDNATITSIVYNGKTYTWDTTGTLIGSNWEDASGKTLVSQVTDDFQAAILAGTWDPEAGFVMSVHDDYDHSATVTFKLVILNTLDTEIGSAKAYVYDPVYPYVGSWAFDDPNNVYTMTYDDTTFAPGAMNDLARYLGALYRQSGSTVAAILYDGTTYTWDTTGTLAGSNWEDADGKTLVSVITADVLAGEIDPDVGLILTLSDVFHTENVTFKAVINDTTAPEVESITAIGAGEFDDVAAVGTTITVNQGYTVDHTEIVLNEPVTVADGTVVTLAGQPYGTIAVDSTGLILTITPYPGNQIADKVGSFVFSLPVGSIEDLAGNALEALSVTLVVNNTAPVAVDDAYTVLEDTVLTVPAAIGVLANDIDYDPLTASIVTTTANGTLTLNTDGGFVYTPALDFFGTDTFTYKASDGTADSEIATVTITVTPVKDQVEAVDDAYETKEGVTLSVSAPGVLANDVDPDINLWTASLVTDVSNGTLTLNSDGSFVYIPDANFFGKDTFVYKLTTYLAPTSLWSDTATVTITVHEVSGTIEPDGGTGQIPGGTPLVITNIGDNVSFMGEIAWYPEDLAVGRAAGNRVGVEINAPDGYDTTNSTFTFNGKTYNWVDVTDGDNYVWVYPLVTATPQHWDIVVSWNPGAVQTFTVDVLTGSTLQPAKLGTIERDPGNTGDVPGGTALTVTQAGNTINFEGEIAWYPADLSLGRTEGNRVGVEINAPAGLDTTNTTFTFNGNTYNWEDVADGDNFVWIYPKVTEVPQSWDIVVTWETGNVQTFTINVLTGSTLEEPVVGTIEPDGGTGQIPGGTPLVITNIGDNVSYKGEIAWYPEDLAIGRTAGNRVGVEINAPAGFDTTDTTFTFAGSTYTWDEVKDGSNFVWIYPKVTTTPQNWEIVVTWRAGVVQTFTVDVLTDSTLQAPIQGTIEPDGGTGQIPGGTPLVITNIGDNVSYQGEIAWYPADPGVGRNVAGNWVGVEINAPAGFDTSSTTFTINGGTAYEWDLVKDGSNFVWVYPLVTTTPQHWDIVVTWETGNVQTFTVDVLTGSTLQPAKLGTIERDPGNTGDVPGGTPLTVTQAGDTINFEGEIAYYPADDALGRTEGNRVGIEINAPAGLDTTNTTFTFAGNTYNWEDVADGDNFVWIYPKVTEVPQSWDIVVTWETGNVQTFTVNVLTGSTLDVGAPVVGSGVAKSASDGDVNLVDGKFTVNQGYVVDTIDITMDEPVLVDLGTIITMVGHGPYGTVTAHSGVLITITPYAGNETASVIGSFSFTAPDGAITDLIGNAFTGSVGLEVINVAPVATDDEYTVAEDTVLSVLAATGVLANDTDFDPTVLTAVLVTDAANGTLVLNEDGSFTYTPDTNYHGTDTFTYKANDGTADSEIATVTITVTPVNDAPVAEEQTVTTDEDTALVITLVATDVDNDTLTFAVVEQPEHGTLTGTAPNLTYTPDADWNGEDSFTFKANDGIADSNVATVSITVTAVNDAPSLAPIAAATIPELAEYSFTATATDPDLPAQELTFSLVGAPTGAAITIDGVFTWTPTEAQGPGVYTFTVKVCDDTDPTPLCDEQEITLTVTEVNLPPVLAAIGDKTIEALQTLSFTSTATDPDMPVQTLTFSLVGAPTGASINPLTGAFTWTPTDAQVGEHEFDVCVSDGLLIDCETITVTVTERNFAPVAVNDAYTTPFGTTLTVPTPGVLGNDADANDDTLTAMKVTNPGNGTLTLNANGSFTYVPNTGFSGVDTFTYKANDGELDSNTATVTITVGAFVNTPPVAQNQSVSTPEDTAIAITLVATDVDGQPLTYAIVTQPAHGTVSLIGNVATYTPSLNYHGTDSFTFKANDGIADSNVATVSITVSAVNDAPVAVDDAYMVEESGELTINAPGVLKNDTDVDGDSLTAILVDDVTNGTLTLNANGSFVYTPTAYFNGTDSFTYKASDGTLQSDLAVVTITVTPVNEWVIANDDYYETLADEILVKDAAEGVLANDVLLDPEEIVSIQIMESPEFGTLTINDDGSFTYIPDAGFMGTDTFRYLVMSVNPVTLQGEWSDDAFVTIVVKPFQMIYLPLMFK